MKNVMILISFSLLFLNIACKPKIEGKIIDNFNEPVENVEISILNSGFINSSDKEGNFEIEYAPGKFEINFKKENYVSVTKSLDISEGKNYPLGMIQMTRIPDTTGIFFKGKTGFIEIPAIKLKTESITRAYFGVGDHKIGDRYFLTNQNVFKIKLEDQETTVFFDNTPLELFLLESENNYVAENKDSHTFGLGKSIYGNQVNLNVQRLNSNVRKREFTPEVGKKYVFITYKSLRHDTSKEMTKTAYAFEFIE